MRIGIAGYGQMGRVIRQKALDAGHEVPEIIDPVGNSGDVTARDVVSISARLDVIIDFTTPHVVTDNIENYGKMKIPAVIGTTGWHEEMSRVAAVVSNSGIGLIWSSNFSLGVNLFFQLIKAAGNIMNPFPDYDAAVHEYHHRYKTDSPSGTARMIGEIMINKLDRKMLMTSELSVGRIEKNALHISSTRCGSIPGTHRVVFDSDVDTIVLEHTARNREGFAEGAIAAAEWIRDRKGMFNMDDMMESIIGGVKDR